MPDLTRDDVAHLAMLARIDLSDAELDKMVGELAVILESVATVQQAPIDDVEPMSHPNDTVNHLEADEPRPDGVLPTEALMRMAPEKHEPFVRVPGVFASE